MGDELTIRVSSVAELTADLAHSINSPLMALFAALDLARGHLRETPVADTAGAVEAMAEVHAAAERIRAVVDHMTRQLAPGTLPAVTATPAPPIASDPRPTPEVRILIVDDDAALGRVLKRVLRDYDVVALASPREALARVASGESFDFVLCDLMMPEMTGRMLHEEIARIAPHQAERVVFMTGGATNDADRELLATTRQPVLGKPFGAETLRALIRRFIVKPPPAS